MSIDEQSLPFSDMKQNAILGHILLNTDGFRQQAIHRMHYSWFKSNLNSKIFTYVKRYCEKKGVTGTYKEILEYEDIRSEDTQMRHKISVAVSIAMGDADQIRLAAIKDDLTVWMQAKILQDAIGESAQHWNRKEFGKSAEIAESMVKRYYAAKFEDNEQVSFDGPEIWLHELETSHLNCISIGLPILDSYIMSNQTCGSLQAGASTVVLAPVNVGKSKFLHTTAIHNVKRQKSVLFMTHEDRFEDVRVRMLQCYLRMDINTLLDTYKTEEGLKRVKDAAAEISKYITYIPVNKPGMTIEDVIPTINRAQERRRMNNGGRGFDLLINDYPGKLSAEGAANNQYRHTQDQVYDGFVQLALQHRWHSMVAMQVNRTGSKINKGQKGVEERLLTMEDAAEAWGPMTTATTVLTLNRGPKAIKDGGLTVLVAKSRTSEAGRAVYCKTDYAREYTHGEDLGGWGYSGSVVLDDVIDQCADDQNKNKTIDNAAINKAFQD